MSTSQLPMLPAKHYTLPSTPKAIWLIAQRGALEALRNRSTLLIGVLFSVLFPVYLETAILHQVATGPQHQQILGVTMVSLLLVVGLFNTSAASSIAAGVFAGEKEKGNLTPLLATPVSNVAIFGGKILSAVLPALVFALIAEIVYLGAVVRDLGLASLELMPIFLVLATVILIPALAIFSATIVSIVSSRVRTYTAASTVGGLVMLPIWFGALALTQAVLHWGGVTLLLAIAVTLLVDAILIIVGATTWRREEVLAKL